MQIVSFNYGAGSHPGARRVVYDAKDSVLRTLKPGGTFEGIDMETGEYRRFSKNKISGIKKENGSIVQLSLLPGGYSGDTLVAQYKYDGKLAYHDTYNKVVVAVDWKKAPEPTRIQHFVLPAEKRPTYGFGWDKGRNTIHLVTEGKDIRLHQYGSRSELIINPTAQELIDALKNVI